LTLNKLYEITLSLSHRIRRNQFLSFQDIIFRVLEWSSFQQG